MRAVFCHDTYYSRDKDNIYAHGAFPYRLWQERFLPHFESFTVIGREASPGQKQNLDLASGPNVNFVLLENINTPLKRLFQSGSVKRAIENQIKNADALIVRGPVEFAMIAAKAARKNNIPYAVEMSGCAFDHTWHHGSLIGKIYAPVKFLRARRMVRQAAAVIYVTQSFLQKRYPASGLSESASNVDLPVPQQHVLEKRIERIQSGRKKIIFGLIGNFGNNLKGLGVALNALGHLKNDLSDFEFRILGHGNPDQWSQKIHHHGLQEQIRFFSPIPGGDAVYRWLDEIDIYLQPSYHEGLPRAVIEAMSRACPALSSDAGGGEELLDQSCIHKRGDFLQLSNQIRQMLSKERQTIQALQNFEKSRNYARDVLQPKRTDFWKAFAAIASKKSL